MDGPFYFAWSDADERTFGVDHMRMDEDIFDFNITHSEGDFASLTVTVENPRSGLLAPGRKVWVWFAFNKVFNPAADEASVDDVVPLFFGRLVGMPDNLDAETVSLEFVARPEDFAAQKEAVAESKKVAPYWDPIWFNPDNLDDPDNVLESRPELWHVNPITLNVTTSNITNGEDGVLTFDEDNVFYDSVSVSYNGSPLRTVNVTATVTWDQKAKGEVGLHDYCGHGLYHSIVTYTGDQLIENWPKEGASIGGGWKVGKSSIQRLDRGKASWTWADMIPHLTPYDGKSLWCPPWAVPRGDGVFTYVGHLLKVPKQMLVGTLSAAFDVSRSKSETLTFSLTADVQSVITEPDDGAALDLTFSSSELASPIDPGGALPIRSVASRSYFPMARGTQSIEYLIALARSKLIASARCVHVGFEVSFLDAINAGLSLRKSGVLTDGRMPGGLAGGKITEYQLSGDGSSGEFKGAVTLACSVGKGGSVESVEGTPTYVEEGYVERGWQRYEGEYILPGAGDVGYQSITGMGCADDGFDFERLTAAHIVTKAEKTNLVDGQELLIPTTAERPEDVFAILNEKPCTWQIDLKPITSGPFATSYETVCTELKIAKTIDLEADGVSS